MQVTEQTQNLQKQMNSISGMPCGERRLIRQI